MISFVALPGGGLKVTDELDRRAYFIGTDRVVTPTPCETNDFPVPVDRAVTIETDGLSFDGDFGFNLRDADGEFLTQVFKERKELPRGDYYIDMSTMSKTYIRVNDAEIVATAPDGRSDEKVTFEFDRPVTLDIGVRSAHSRPAGTITTTDDPHDMMRAVSYLGSSLKELSCERSWPTLRGHPPRIELGNTFRAPRDIEPPETGITIEVPATYEYIYAVAPLAFYMGANVTKGDSARLVTDTGFSFPLGTADEVSATAFLVQKHCHLLDCIVRNGGYYEYDSYEGNRLGDDLPFDPEDLREAPITEQVEAYLSVPFETVADFLPTGGEEVVLTTDPHHIEHIPFLASDLVCVRVEDAPEDKEPTGGLLERARDVLSGILDSGATSDREAATVEASDGVPTVDDLTDTRATATEGRPPFGYNQIVPEAFMNRIRRDPLDAGRFASAVVCNDDEMWDEVQTAAHEYDTPEFDDSEVALDIKRNLTTDELASLLMDDYQFLHYVGHIDEDGFVCADGTLDIRTLPYVGIDGFLLNACNSHKQGVELIRKGGIGGIVTLTDVVTGGAIEMGARLSALLSLGYPIGRALSISMEADPVFTGQYRVVGDSKAELRQMEGGEFIFSSRIRSISPDSYVVDVQSHETSGIGIGGINRTFSDVVTDESYITGTTMTSDPLTADEIMQYLQNNDGVVFLPNGSLFWTTDVELDDLLNASEPHPPLD